MLEKDGFAQSGTVADWVFFSTTARAITPLILVGKMYADLVAWARTSMLDPKFPLASPEDMDIPLCVNTADEAIAAIRKHQAAWRKAQRRRRP